MTNPDIMRDAAISLLGVTAFGLSISGCSQPVEANNQLNTRVPVVDTGSKPQVAANYSSSLDKLITQPVNDLWRAQKVRQGFHPVVLDWEIDGKPVGSPMIRAREFVVDEIDHPTNLRRVLPFNTIADQYDILASVYNRAGAFPIHRLIGVRENTREVWGEVVDPRTKLRGWMALRYEGVDMVEIEGHTLRIPKAYGWYEKGFLFTTDAPEALLP